MKITLHPAAEEDLQEAATFYEREGAHRAGIDELKILVVKHDSKRPGFGARRA